MKPDDFSGFLIAKSATVEGRVQGVGFRWSAIEEARRLHLSGWIRNADDGSVETYFEGSEAAVDAFIAWLRKGPGGARVDAVTFRSAIPTGAYRGFVVEP
ncbi:MAG: acylphosphatase [Treponemataceae bacterium]